MEEYYNKLKAIESKKREVRAEIRMAKIELKQLEREMISLRKEKKRADKEKIKEEKLKEEEIKQKLLLRRKKIINDAKTIHKKYLEVRKSLGSYVDNEFFIEKDSNGNVYGKYRDKNFQILINEDTNTVKILRLGQGSVSSKNYDEGLCDNSAIIPVYLVSLIPFSKRGIIKQDDLDLEKVAYSRNYRYNYDASEYDKLAKIDEMIHERMMR